MRGEPTVILEVELYVSVIYHTNHLVLMLITGLPFLIKKSVKGSLIIHQITAAQFLLLLSLRLSIPILIIFTSSAPVCRHEAMSNTSLFGVKMC